MDGAFLDHHFKRDGAEDKGGEDSYSARDAFRKVMNAVPKKEP